MKNKFKKIKRYLIVFISIIFIFVVPFSVSAIDVNTLDYTFEISQPVATTNSGYIEVITENWGPILFYFSASMPSYASLEPSSFSFRAYVEDNTFYIQAQPDTYASKDLFIDVCGFYMHYDGYSTWLHSDNVDGGMTSRISLWLGNAGQIVGARGYNVDLTALGVSGNFPSFIYGSDNRIYNQLNDIIAILQSQNNGDIVGAIEQSESAIKENQDENTDKVINGWQQSEGPDTTITDNYAEQDAALQESTSVGRSETVSLFNSFGSLFQSDGHLYKGLLSVTAIFSELTKIEWVGSILNFALAIGVFAFVIGTGSQVFRSAHERREERKIDNIPSDDERWLY